jgi:hypothetical protein
MQQFSPDALAQAITRKYGRLPMRQTDPAQGTGSGGGEGNGATEPNETIVDTKLNPLKHLVSLCVWYCQDAVTEGTLRRTLFAAFDAHTAFEPTTGSRRDADGKLPHQKVAWSFLPVVALAAGPSFSASNARKVGGGGGSHYTTQPVMAVQVTAHDLAKVEGLMWLRAEQLNVSFS